MAEKPPEGDDPKGGENLPTPPPPPPPPPPGGSSTVPPRGSSPVSNPLSAGIKGTNLKKTEPKGNPPPPAPAGGRDDLLAAIRKGKQLNETGKQVKEEDNGVKEPPKPLTGLAAVFDKAIKKEPNATAVEPATASKEGEGKQEEKKEENVQEKVLNLLSKSKVDEESYAAVIEASGVQGFEFEVDEWDENKIVKFPKALTTEQFNAIETAAQNQKTGVTVEPPPSSTPTEDQKEPPSQSAPLVDKQEPPASRAPTKDQTKPPSQSTPLEDKQEPPASSAPTEDQTKPPSQSAPLENKQEPPAQVIPSDKTAKTVATPPGTIPPAPPEGSIGPGTIPPPPPGGPGGPGTIPPPPPGGAPKIDKAPPPRPFDASALKLGMQKLKSKDEASPLAEKKEEKKSDLAASMEGRRTAIGARVGQQIADEIAEERNYWEPKNGDFQKKYQAALQDKFPGVTLNVTQDDEGEYFATINDPQGNLAKLDEDQIGDVFNEIKNKAEDPDFKPSDPEGDDLLPGVDPDKLEEAVEQEQQRVETEAEQQTEFNTDATEQTLQQQEQMAKDDAAIKDNIAKDQQQQAMAAEQQQQPTEKSDEPNSSIKTAVAATTVAAALTSKEVEASENTEAIPEPHTAQESQKKEPEQQQTTAKQKQPEPVTPDIAQMQASIPQPLITKGNEKKAEADKPETETAGNQQEPSKPQPKREIKKSTLNLPKYSNMSRDEKTNFLRDLTKPENSEQDIKDLLEDQNKYQIAKIHHDLQWNSDQAKSQNNDVKANRIDDSIAKIDKEYINKKNLHDETRQYTLALGTPIDHKGDDGMSWMPPDGLEKNCDLLKSYVDSNPDTPMHDTMQTVQTAMQKSLDDGAAGGAYKDDTDIYNDLSDVTKLGSAEKVAERAKSGEPAYIPIAIHGHVYSASIVDDKFILSNRGSGGGKANDNTRIFQITEEGKKNIDNAVATAMHTRDNTTVLNAFSQIVDLNDPVAVLDHKGQKYGNCILANPRSHVEGMALVIEANKRDIDISKPSEKLDRLKDEVKSTHKDFTAHSRTETANRLAENLINETDPEKKDLYAEIATSYITKHQNDTKLGTDERCTVLRGALVDQGYDTPPPAMLNQQFSDLKSNDDQEEFLSQCFNDQHKSLVDKTLNQQSDESLNAIKETTLVQDQANGNPNEHKHIRDRVNNIQEQRAKEKQTQQAEHQEKLNLQGPMLNIQNYNDEGAGLGHEAASQYKKQMYNKVTNDLEKNYPGIKVDYNKGETHFTINTEGLTQEKRSDLKQKLPEMEKEAADSAKDFIAKQQAESFQPKPGKTQAEQTHEKSENQNSPTEQNSNTQPKLVCLDFDQTLVKGHFHGSLAYGDPAVEPGQATPEDIQKLLDDPNRGLKNGDEMRDTIRNALNDGHNVAITSFTSYPEVVEPTLKKMGLTEDEIAKIHVEGWLPPTSEERSTHGKQRHIENSMQHFGMDPKDPEQKANTMLVDDDPNNVKIAKREGFAGVQVPKSKNASADSYIPKIQDHLQPKLNLEGPLLNIQNEKNDGAGLGHKAASEYKHQMHEQLSNDLEKDYPGIEVNYNKGEMYFTLNTDKLTPEQRTDLNQRLPQLEKEAADKANDFIAEKQAEKATAEKKAAIPEPLTPKPEQKQDPAKQQEENKVDSKATPEKALNPSYQPEEKPKKLVCVNFRETIKPPVSDRNANTEREIDRIQKQNDKIKEQNQQNADAIRSAIKEGHNVSIISTPRKLGLGNTVPGENFDKAHLKSLGFEQDEIDKIHFQSERAPSGGRKHSSWTTGDAMDHFKMDPNSAEDKSNTILVGASDNHAAKAAGFTTVNVNAADTNTAQALNNHLNPDPPGPKLDINLKPSTSHISNSDIRRVWHIDRNTGESFIGYQKSALSQASAEKFEKQMQEEVASRLQEQYPMLEFEYNQEQQRFTVNVDLLLDQERAKVQADINIIEQQVAQSAEYYLDQIKTEGPRNINQVSPAPSLGAPPAPKPSLSSGDNIGTSMSSGPRPSLSTGYNPQEWREGLGYAFGTLTPEESQELREGLSAEMGGSGLRPGLESGGPIAGAHRKPGLESGDIKKVGLESGSADSKLGSKISDKKKPKVGKEVPTGKNWYDLIKMILKLLMEDGLLKGMTDGLVKGIPEAAVNLIGAGIIQGMKEASEGDNPSSIALGFLKGFAVGTAKSPGIALSSLINRVAHEVISHSEYAPLLKDESKATKQDKDDPAAQIPEKAAQFTHSAIDGIQQTVQSGAKLASSVADTIQETAQAGADLASSVADSIQETVQAGASLVASAGKEVKAVGSRFVGALGKKDKETGKLRENGDDSIGGIDGPPKTMMHQWNAAKPHGSGTLEKNAPEPSWKLGVKPNEPNNNDEDSKKRRFSMR